MAVQTVVGWDRSSVVALVDVTVVESAVWLDFASVVVLAVG